MINNSLRQYLREVGRYALLTPEEEIELSRLVQAGDQRAKKRMIQSNLRLVVAIAKKHRNRGVPLMDLIQEGNIGLSIAVDKYDPTTGCRFSTYAYWWIRQAVTRAVQSQSRTIRLPTHMSELGNKIKRTQQRLSQELGRIPGIPELATALDMEPGKLKQTLQLYKQVTSLDLLIGESQEHRLGDFIVGDDDPVANLQHAFEKEQVAALLALLDERQRFAVVERFGLEDGQPKSYQHIGNQMGVTREGVRQLVNRAVRRLQKKVQVA